MGSNTSGVAGYQAGKPETSITKPLDQSDTFGKLSIITDIAVPDRIQSTLGNTGGSSADEGSAEEKPHELGSTSYDFKIPIGCYITW